MIVAASGREGSNRKMIPSSGFGAKPTRARHHREHHGLAQRAGGGEHRARDQRRPRRLRHDLPERAPAIHAKGQRALDPRARHRAQPLHEHRRHQRGDHHDEDQHSRDQAVAGERDRVRHRLLLVRADQMVADERHERRARRAARRSPTARSPAAAPPGAARHRIRSGANSTMNSATNTAQTKLTITAVTVIEQRAPQQRPGVERVDGLSRRGRPRARCSGSARPRSRRRRTSAARCARRTATPVTTTKASIATTSTSIAHDSAPSVSSARRSDHQCGVSS